MLHSAGVDNSFLIDVLLPDFGEVKFAFLFEVGKDHENKEDRCDDKSNDGVNNWKRSRDWGEWELGFGDPAVGDIELGIRFSRGFYDLPVNAIVVVGGVKV